MTKLSNNQDEYHSKSEMKRVETLKAAEMSEPNKAQLESALRAILAVSERRDSAAFNAISDAARRVLYAHPPKPPQEAAKLPVQQELAGYAATQPEQVRAALCCALSGTFACKCKGAY